MWEIVKQKACGVSWEVNSWPLRIAVLCYSPSIAARTRDNLLMCVCYTVYYTLTDNVCMVSYIQILSPWPKVSEKYFFLTPQYLNHKPSISLWPQLRNRLQKTQDKMQWKSGLWKEETDVSYMTFAQAVTFIRAPWVLCWACFTGWLCCCCTRSCANNGNNMKTCFFSWRCVEICLLLCFFSSLVFRSLGK